MTHSLPDSTALPSNADVLAEASRMSNIERFIHLLRHAEALIRQYGPYTTHKGTKVFIRAPTPCIKEPSPRDLALSFAAAQDCSNSAQPSGPANDDLRLFFHLWTTTITILEDILARGSLPQESFGWGIFGLAAGYIHPPSPSNDLTTRNLFSNQKYRLHAALSKLPSLDGAKRSEYVVSEKTKIAELVRTRREIHTCGHIILDEVRKEGWARVRWLHAMAVAERWIGAFGLMPQKVDKKVEKEVKAEKQEQVLEDKRTVPKLPAFSFP
ncbi:hypothetical protein BDW02DRAFT_372225 [Decorospora gaudefroyi]|uniref:Uncharacterized protein n=1 Tax=Decorospora gaudefroyi TaxID=184978 RepID=A0A6A5KEU7_9PLEO|nr:hypothetical protein BDW02DRAFT_372225 [Decorospora gaudefroyi]